MRNYSFRKLTPDDLPLMQRWLQASQVRVWWPNVDKQIALMQQDMENPEINMLVVSLINHPFAYIHDHDARSFGMPQYADLPPGTRVIATFVGDTDFMGQGHSAGYIDARLRDLRLRYPMVAVGPNTTDTRAIGIYSQAGFHKRRLASTRDGKLVQVMTHL
ncbi:MULTISPECIES: GNAT family N-acetyltransferase [unclassified Cognatiyoonia]|uniref:GNAT family N-acetyltransferase n=1 Tax=unclassified Cognatiyoonia TaxID=2635977 RepID=UPI002A0FD664|nr:MULTISPECIES: GNAT family N-acetyltransferase [unclassified Cognatiyoonia]MDX8348165.1 GNAT family N-acetyltransferase [Cognatiyoonia sp. IB215446]MDX8351112.1 GNAT family N-acetyltransferase [Cognatiyoonia sp. IB215182]